MHTNIKAILKTSVAAAALVAVSAPVSADINNGNTNSLIMSGQIARSMVYQDNGNDTELFNVDGIDTNSRLRWIASGKMTESVTVGGIVEMNFPLSNSNYALDADIDFKPDSADWGMRKTEVTFTHKAAGKLSIGQNSAAGDGAHTNTLGSWGPSMSAYGKGGAGASNFWVTNANELPTVDAAIATNIPVNIVTGGFNLGRNDRIRYDTPSIGGLKLAASYGADAGSGIEVTYAGKFGSVQVASAAMYQRAETDDFDESQKIMGGSIAVKHDSGLSAHVGYSRINKFAVADLELDVTSKSKEWHGGIGYAANLTNLGITGFAINYTQSDHSLTIGENTFDADGTTFGIAVNQNIEAVGTDVFLSYSRTTFDVDDVSAQFDDFSTIMAGTHLNF